MAVASKILFGLDTATTIEQRLKWIADPEKHRDSMERLLTTRGGRLNTGEVQPMPAVVRELPGGKEVQLFRVSAPSLRNGALVHLMERDGAKVLDWALFAQTYDYTFDRYVATNRAVAGQAEWFTVLCSVAPKPPGTSAGKETHLKLSLTGSLSETGVADAWVARNSPAGRYLEKELASGKTYLLEVQLGTDQGSRRLMVLDCGPTRSTNTAQANANN